MTKFLLDSGDPQEYIELSELAKQNNQELWGATTNPSLIAKSAKKITNDKKLTKVDAFRIQKEIIEDILKIVPGSVSAEVYADLNTTSDEMVKQGLEIASWSDRITIKLPTTVESFKARTELRKQGITTNNTLVFTQEQIFAICLHEQIIQEQFGPIPQSWPPFISPFVGRLDDIGINGMDLIRTGMRVKSLLKNEMWMLEASVRSVDHLNQGIAAKSELITAPIKVYKEFFSARLPDINPSILNEISLWTPSQNLMSINSIDTFMDIISSGELNIQDDLTTAGIEKFTTDWNSLFS